MSWHGRWGKHDPFAKPAVKGDRFGCFEVIRAAVPDAHYGNRAHVRCVECGRREPRLVAQAQWAGGIAVPRCECGGAWKPDTISFGQGLVEEDLERAMRAAANCALFVAAGTSLVVSPVNQMFDVAVRAGAKTAILTASSTPYDLRSFC